MDSDWHSREDLAARPAYYYLGDSKPLNFDKYVFEVERKPEGESNLPEIIRRLAAKLESHKDDPIK